MKWIRATLAALVAALLAFAPAADAGPPSHAQAKRALAEVRQLQQGKGVKTGRELTPALQQLFASLPSLSGDDRAAAKAILARPTDGPADPQGDGYAIPEATPVCGAHFCIHYVVATSDAPSLADGPDAGSTPDYVDQMLSVFENEVYPCENGTDATACAGTPGLGWRAPVSDGTRGGNDKVDVYLKNLGPERVFGYVALDPGQSQDPNVPHYGYMVMDNDYAQTEFGYADPLLPLRVTAAHEYNHVLQNAYDFREDPWMFESTAVYMEDKVYPALNDYLNYVKAWVANTKTPLTAFPSTNLKPYGSAVWNHWLDHRFGPGAVRAAWEQSIAAGDFAPGAYSAAISAAGGGAFTNEFDLFSAAVAEWQAPGAGFPDRYPDVPRDGVLPAGMQTSPFALPHTTFALFDVPIPVGVTTIRLTGTLPAGTSGAIALVGRTGPDPAAGTVTTNLTHMPNGGTDVVSLDNPGQFGRITAVIVNDDPSRSGFDPTLQDWVFTKDAGGVSLGLAQPGPPVPVTGAPTQLADHSATVSGSLDPRLVDSTWQIQYGLTTAYGSASELQTVPGSTVGFAPVSAQLPGLKANSTYHYRLVASNSTGSAQGADVTFTTPRDITKPKVAFSVKRQKIKTVRARGLTYLGRCSERCLGTAQLTVPRALARKLGTLTVLGKSRITLDPKTQSTTLHVRMTGRTKKKLKGLRKSFKAALKIRVADESRNAVTVSRRLTLTG